ncbi:MAG: carboxymuconolactone decarboxylase family protein [Hadesarchaea archaeon]|nr:carboxymuconolactone decarboxylase family protein [Hadesarchaea archaeon]
MSEIKKAIDNYSETMRLLMKIEKEPMHNYKNFMDSVLEAEALDTKTKELVALGTAITARCKYCIGLHVRNSLSAGATKEEILEAASVAIMMGGNPALTHVTEVKEALEEFEET